MPMQYLAPPHVLVSVILCLLLGPASARAQSTLATVTGTV